MNYITKNNLDDFCITNEKYLVDGKQKIKGLVVEFPGFDGNSCFGGNFNNTELNTYMGQRLAVNNILLVYVFTGPWNWMRDVSVNTVDNIIESVIEKYNLDTNIKIVLSGGSMGGLGALSYATYGKFKAISCAVSCPVCDLFAVSKFSHYFAASVYFACCHYNCEYDEAVKKLSPLYFVDKFPNIDYFILYCDNDQVIKTEENALPLINKMQEKELNLEIYRVYGAGHCEHSMKDNKKFVEYILNSFNK